MLSNSLTTYLSAQTPPTIRKLQGSCYSSIHLFSHLLLALKLETAVLAWTDKDIMTVMDGVPETYAGDMTDFRDVHKWSEEIVFSLVEPVSWSPSEISLSYAVIYQMIW